MHREEREVGNLVLYMVQCTQNSLRFSVMISCSVFAVCMQPFN